MSYPTKKLGETDLKILALVKAMYKRGCDFARNKDVINKMLAIHAFDNAVEMILNLVAEGDKLPKDKQKINFHDLLGASGLDSTTKSQLKGLHDQRNPVQHHADISDYETIIKYKAYTEDFLKTILKDRFNLLYEDVSLALLIKNNALRELFKSAENAFLKKDYRSVIELCEKALIETAFSVGDIFRKAGLLMGYFKGGDEFGEVIKSDYAERYKGKDYYEFAREISKAFLQLGQGTTVMQFFIDHRIAFLEHRWRVENLEIIPDEKLKESAVASLDFVINLILKWQEEKIL